MPNQSNQTLRDRMLAVMADVNAQVAEREELVEAIAIALLTRKNLFGHCRCRSGLSPGAQGSGSRRPI